MPQRRKVVGPPVSYLRSGGDWPDGPFRADAPAAIGHATTISRRITQRLEAHAISRIAEQADLARTTIYDIINGRTWPDIVTLAKLEDVLDTTLWPARTKR